MSVAKAGGTWKNGQKVGETWKITALEGVDLTKPDDIARIPAATSRDAVQAERKQRTGVGPRSTSNGTTGSSTGAGSSGGGNDLLNKGKGPPEQDRQTPDIMTRHLILSILLLPLASFGQLSGIHTVGGTSPDYATLTDAFNALMTQGANGNVDLLIRPGTTMGQYDLGSFRITRRASPYEARPTRPPTWYWPMMRAARRTTSSYRLDGTEQLHFQADLHTMDPTYARAGTPERGAWADIRDACSREARRRACRSSRNAGWW